MIESISRKTASEKINGKQRLVLSVIIDLLIQVTVPGWHLPPAVIILKVRAVVTSDEGHLVVAVDFTDF